MGAATSEATPGQIEITCTAVQSGTTVTIDGGQNSTGGQRRLESGGNYMAYGVYSDAGHTSSISIDGTLYSGNIAAGTPQSMLVYGRIPSGTYMAGTYTDVLVVTLTY